MNLTKFVSDSLETLKCKRLKSNVSRQIDKFNIQRPDGFALCYA